MGGRNIFDYYIDKTRGRWKLIFGAPRNKSGVSDFRRGLRELQVDIDAAITPSEVEDSLWFGDNYRNRVRSVDIGNPDIFPRARGGI